MSEAAKPASVPDPEDKAKVIEGAMKPLVDPQEEITSRRSSVVNTPTSDLIKVRFAGDFEDPISGQKFQKNHDHELPRVLADRYAKLGIAKYVNEDGKAVSRELPPPPTDGLINRGKPRQPSPRTRDVGGDSNQKWSEEEEKGGDANA